MQAFVTWRSNAPKARYLFEMLRKRPPATCPRLPHDNPHASLEVLAWHAEPVDAANLDTRKAVGDIAGEAQGVANCTPTTPSPVRCLVCSGETIT